MIPKKKKTQEELAALREELGIPDAPPLPGAPRNRPLPQPEKKPEPAPEAKPAKKPAPPAEKEMPTPKLDPAHPDASPAPILREPVVHLDPDAPDLEEAETEVREPVQYHSLRKKELPLAPAPAVTHKTSLPAHRHGDDDIARLRKREALEKLQQPQLDPSIQLRAMTASPWLLAPAYIVALGAGATIWQRFHHISPIILLVLSSLLTLYIFLKKKRSRHHAAILFLIILMTLVFGGLHYAPIFQNAP